MSHRSTPAPRDPDAALERFLSLLRIPTVSSLDETVVEWEQFVRFREVLATAYPLVHRVLERRVIADHSLLFRWAGREPGEATVLMAHYDVVPAPADGWTHAPFEPTIVGSGPARTIWGRGTLDDKGSLVAVLEAVESLLDDGFQPLHDVYLSFGHNEETAGGGAVAIVDTLRAEGVRAALVLDEGGAIVQGVFPGVAGEVAMVGVSEKGILTVELAAEQDGGHASTPQRTTATTTLARAITRVADRQYPARLSAPTVEMLQTLGAHAREPYASLFRAARRLRVPLAQVFARLGAETNAMVRTTAAVTQLHGSEGANVLAERATAIVNIRIAVGSTVARTVSFLRRIIGDDGVAIRIIHASEPSHVSPTTGSAWNDIRACIEAEYPGTIVAPYIMLGASDSRHFTAISDAVYRFTPFRMSAGERATLHAMDERIGAETWLSGITFYRRLLERR